MDKFMTRITPNIQRRDSFFIPQGGSGDAALVPRIAPPAEGTNWTQELFEQERLWESVFDDPSKWRDCRPAKAKGDLPSNHADFIRPSSGEGVEVETFFAPVWLEERMEAADRESPWALPSEDDIQKFTARLVEQEENEVLSRRWDQLFATPKLWKDCRPLKQLGCLPEDYADFVVIESARTEPPFHLHLLDARTPEWVAASLQQADEAGSTWKLASGSSADGPWVRLFLQPDAWTDFRQVKQDGDLVAAHPDFVEERGNQVLWLDSAPVWAKERLAVMASEGTSLPSRQYLPME